jgi:serine/threonine-protein kinase RsbT
VAAVHEVLVPIGHEMDIVTARQKGREIAAGSGFPSTEQTLIATAISEVARNIVVYAQRGEIELQPLESRGRRGIQVVARDNGPGIPDIDLAMRDGYSTGRSLGMGLPGTKRLMDEFELTSALGKGTIVTLRKWVR